MRDYPFLRPEFLDALEASDSAVASTGWEPHHLTVGGEGTGTAFMPLYLKGHSMGEYVFDFGWADAYRRNGLAYYPKLLTAIPFTPASGPRVRFSSDADRTSLVGQLTDRVVELARENHLSSWHLLFPDEDQLALFRDQRLLHRRGVQYHWFNRGYDSFDDFLGALTSRKRKSLRKERRQVAEQALTTERLTGADLTQELLEEFWLFYQRTYLKRSGSTGYLTGAFFSLIGETLADQTLMTVARHEGRIVAAALYFFDDETLFGRYWGCLEEYDVLHFELCYYQGIEFAIERGLKKFDAGAQGEHKVIRGFEPVVTHSLHWIAEPAFEEAIARFLEQESRYIDQHVEQAREALPYKATD